jgi:hypothetical protein
MRRIYLLLPNVHSAQMIISELLLLRVEWRHIHVTANHNVPLKDLPEAILTQRSDLLPALARGAAMGGLTGTLAGRSQAARSWRSRSVARALVHGPRR